MRNSCRCKVVLTECSGRLEIPDAMGWKDSMSIDSILVECKASRSDFFADLRKEHRRDPNCPENPGDLRYYLTPPRLLKSEEIPTGWGLIEAHEGRIITIVAAPKRPFNAMRRAKESQYFFSELLKIQFAMSGRELMPTKSGRRIMDYIRKRPDLSGQA